MAGKSIATNKKAFHNFFLSQKWECGIVLTGGEVKSVRAGEVNFADSFVRIDDGEAVLHNLHITPYLQASYLSTEPDRERKLLLHQREITKIETLSREKGMVLVPTKIYLNAKGFIKLEIALGKGKRLFDKREDIKRRDISRDIQRGLRTRKKPA